MVLGRRHPLALLAAVTIVGATAAFAVQASHHTGLAPSGGHDAAVTAAGADRPAALAARPKDAAQVATGDVRSQRVSGFTLAALLVGTAALLPGHRRLRPVGAAGRPLVTDTRITPARAPPRLRLVTS